MAANARDHVALRTRADEARRIYQAIGDDRGIGDANLFLGQLETEARNLEGARDLYRESSRLFHQVDDHGSELQSKALLGRTLTELGHLEEAQALFDEGLERAHTLGAPRLESMMFMGSAGIAIEKRRAEDALALMKKSLLIEREVGNLLRVRIALGGIARVLSMMGEAEPAARLLACSDALGREITGDFAWVSPRRKDETLALLREQLDEDVLNAAWEQGQTMTLDEGVELALSIA
jgi:tetratricopeptide (TPR) repeat protein